MLRISFNLIVVWICINHGLLLSFAISPPVAPPLGSLDEDRTIALKCAGLDNTGKARAVPQSPNNHELPPPVYTDDSPYLINPGKDLCPGQIHLLVAVHSKPVYQQRRHAIRRTWGSLRQVNRYRVSVVFFLGNPQDAILQALVEKESLSTGDIVQRNFIESYRNMTRKHLVVMEWIATYCPNAIYVLKVDDDTFVDLFHVSRMLDNFDLSQVFYCTSTKGAKPQRSAANPHLRKWIVTQKEFAGTHYPSYCEGFGYLMTGKYARALTMCARYSEFFWIDDVFVTGILAEKLGIERVGFYSGHSYAYMLPSYASERILDYMFLEARYNEFMPLVWSQFWRAVLEHSMIL